MSDVDRQKKWDARFLELAKLVSTWSRDPSTKCGAVIVRPDRTICSLGFNGFVMGMSDDPQLYGDREAKCSRTVHAEMNALLFCRDPLPLKGCTLYTTIPCCDRCVVHALQAGIRRFVFAAPTPGLQKRWNMDQSLKYMAELGAEFVEIPS